MILPDISAALNHSPAHRPELERRIGDTDGSLEAVARAVGKGCRDLGITDFPNPITGYVDHGWPRESWRQNFGLQAQEVGVVDDKPTVSFAQNTPPPTRPYPGEVDPPATDGIAMPDFAGMKNKEAVKEAVLQWPATFNISKMTRMEINVEAERLWDLHARALQRVAQPLLDRNTW